jgi:hypothetical protein
MTNNKDIKSIVSYSLNNVKNDELSNFINYSLIVRTIKENDKIKNETIKFEFLRVLNLIDVISKLSDVSKDSKKELRFLHKIILSYLRE